MARSLTLRICGLTASGVRWTPKPAARQSTFPAKTDQCDDARQPSERGERKVLIFGVRAHIMIDTSWRNITSSQQRKQQEEQDIVECDDNESLPRRRLQVA